MKKILFWFLFASSAFAQPTISAVYVQSSTATTATIVWTTNTPATSQIRYGYDIALQFSNNESFTLVTSHSMTLTVLNAIQPYYFAVVSVDGSGHSAQSSTYEFALCGQAFAPVVGTINQFYYSGTYTLTWNPPAGSSGTPTVCGQTFATTITGTMNLGGSFSSSVADSMKVTPGPGSWTITVADIGDLSPVTITEPLSVQFQDVSTPLQAAAAGTSLVGVIANNNSLKCWPTFVCAGSGVTSLNSLTGALDLTSTGHTVTITPSGTNIDLEATSGMTQLTGDVVAGPGSGSQVATVKGLDSTPFCAGFSPTNGQAVTLTTASSPDPCWTAVGASGGVTNVNTSTQAVQTPGADAIGSTTPWCDIRAYGAKIDNATDIGPYVQDCINNAAPGSGNSYNIFLPCNVGPNGYNDGCLWNNPEALTYSGSQTFNLLVQGYVHLNAGFFPPNWLNVIGVGGGGGIQFGPTTQLASFSGPYVCGTLGTAITSTNTAVQVTPSFTACPGGSAGSIANMPPGSAITVAETTTVSGTATGSRGPVSGETYGAATLTLPSSGAQPRYLMSELINVSGCSDSSFDITNGWIANVDYGASGGEQISYYITATGTGTATGCTVTSFDEDKYETLRLFCSNGVEYGGGSPTCSTGQFTVIPSFQHASTAQWGAVAAGSDFNSASAPHTWENISINGCPGMCFWDELQGFATLVNLQASPVGGIMTAGTMEETASWQGTISGLTLGLARPSSCTTTPYGGGNCTSGSYPYTLKIDNEASAIGYGAGSTGAAGDTISAVKMQGGIKIGNKGGGTSSLPTQINGLLVEEASVGGVTVDNRGGVRGALDIIGMGLQDSYITYPLYDIFYTDIRPANVGSFKLESPSTVLGFTRNPYMNDGLIVDPAAQLTTVEVPANNSGPAGVYNDGRELDGPIRNSGAGYGPQLLPFGTLTVNNSPSYWATTGGCNTSTCAVTTTNVVCPDGPQATSQMQCGRITNPASSGYAAAIPIASWTGNTYAGDAFIYGCKNRPVPGQPYTVGYNGFPNASFYLETAGSDTFTNYPGTDTNIAIPSGFGTNLAYGDWIDQTAIATIGTGEASSHTITLYLTLGPSQNGQGTDFSNCFLTPLIPGPNNSSYAGVTPADLEFARAHQYRGAVPSNVSAGVAATEEAIQVGYPSKAANSGGTEEGVCLADGTNCPSSGYPGVTSPGTGGLAGNPGSGQTWEITPAGGFQGTSLTVNGGASATAGIWEGSGVNPGLVYQLTDNPGIQYASYYQLWKAFNSAGTNKTLWSIGPGFVNTTAGAETSLLDMGLLTDGVSRTYSVGGIRPASPNQYVIGGQTISGNNILFNTPGDVAGYSALGLRGQEWNWLSLGNPFNPAIAPMVTFLDYNQSNTNLCAYMIRLTGGLFQINRSTDPYCLYLGSEYTTPFALSGDVAQGAGPYQQVEMNGGIFQPSSDHGEVIQLLNHAGTTYFDCGTASPGCAFANAAIMQFFSDNFSTLKISLNGSNGNIQTSGTVNATTVNATAMTTGSGSTAIYRCSGGTSDGLVMVSPSTAATACTTGGGSLVSIALTTP